MRNFSLDNTYRSFVGDFMIVHSLSDLKKGEEIFFTYLYPMVSLEERSLMLQSYDFTCNCRLCELDRADPHYTERQKLICEIKSYKSSYKLNPAYSIKIFVPIIKQLRATYKERKELRLQVGIIHKVGMIFMSNSRWEK